MISRAVFFTAFILGFVGFLTDSSALGQQAAVQDQYKSVPPKAGERCIICDVPLTDEDVVLMVRGRRVPLNSGMVDSFMNNQEKYFAELQPKSALFQENLQATAGAAQGGISLGWFLFGACVLLALVSGGISGYLAVSKGLSPIPNFFIGLILNVFGMIYVFTRPAVVEKGSVPAGLAKVPTTNSPVACPKCGEQNHPSARKCGQCGAELRAAYESEVART